MWEYKYISHDDYLAHYGVPGMKWGHRKASASSGPGYDHKLRKSIRQDNRAIKRNQRQAARYLGKALNDNEIASEYKAHKDRLEARRARSTSTKRIERLSKRMDRLDTTIKMYEGSSDRRLKESGKREKIASDIVDRAKKDSRVTSYNRRKRTNVNATGTKGATYNTWSVMYDRDKLVANNKRGKKKAAKRNTAKRGYDARVYRNYVYVY